MIILVLVISILVVIYFGIRMLRKKKDNFEIIKNFPYITLQINPNAKVTVHNIFNDFNVITIDNFLLNIDELSNDNFYNKILNVRTDIPKRSDSPYPGDQYPIGLSNSVEIEKKVKELVGNKLFKFNETKIGEFDPVFSIGKKFKKNIFTTNPHVDSPSRFNYAAMIFLNKPDDCYGGTGIYKSKEINNIIPYVNGKELSRERYNDLYEKSEVIKNSNDKWELMHLLKMKYNRLVIYESSLFHSIYLDSFDLFKKYRYTYNFWFDNPNSDAHPHMANKDPFFE